MTTTNAHMAGRHSRPLGFIWLGLAVPVAVVGLLLTLISDHQADRTAGVFLLVLAAVGAGLGGWILASSDDRKRTASLLTSLVWLVGAAAVYPTQEFLVDKLLVSGVPAAGAVLAAVIAWTARRS